MDMMDVDLSSELAGLHMGMARYAPAPLDGPPSSAAQEFLLSDEDIVEGILFSVTGRAPRPSVFEVVLLNDRIVATLYSALCVSRVWRAAGAKPLLAAWLDRKLADFKVKMDFLAKRRAGELIKEPSADHLAAGDVAALRWLIGGYENGFNSVLADDAGLNSVGPSAGVITHLRALGVTGPFLIVASEAAWPAWREAVASQMLSVVEARSGEEVDASFKNHRRAVMLVPLQLRSGEEQDSLEAALLHWSGRFKYIVLDERSPPRGARLQCHALIRCGTLEQSMGRVNYVRLTHEPLPTTIADLARVSQDLLGADFYGSDFGSDFELGNLEPMLRTCCRGPQGDALYNWAIHAFVVPMVQAYLSRVLYLRRQKRAGVAHVVQVEPPRLTVSGFEQSHWLVGSYVRLCGLKAKPELNDRVGTVHGYDEKADRLEVLLDHQPCEDDRGIGVLDARSGARRRRWVCVRPGNVSRAIRHSHQV